MYPVVEELSRIGLVPVIKIEDLSKAVPLARALAGGGLPCAEVTFRTPQASEAIREITEALPDMLVGAGTVLTPEQVDQAVASGAKFIVSPGLNPRVVEHCLSKEIPVIPGTSTPSDMERAIEYGLETVKFFPAEASGGIKAIKAMAAPYTGLTFMPTGGVNVTNIRDYLSFSRVLCAGGSWMVPDKLLSAGDFEGIRTLTEQAVLSMLDLSFEPGSDGEPIIRTLNIPRAVRYLSAKGYVFEDEASCETKEILLHAPFRARLALK